MGFDRHIKRICDKPDKTSTSGREESSLVHAIAERLQAVRDVDLTPALESGEEVKP